MVYSITLKPVKEKLRIFATHGILIQLERNQVYHSHPENLQLQKCWKNIGFAAWNKL